MGCSTSWQPKKFATLFAQPAALFPRWDARTATWLSGRVGVGFQLSNQTRQLYFFTETDFCFSCAYNYFKRPPQDLHQQLRLNRYRGNLHLKLQTSKDFRLYGTRFYKRSPDVRFRNLSWTYFTAVGLSAEAGLYRPGRLADLESGALTTAFRHRRRLRIRYDVLGLQNSFHGYYGLRLRVETGFYGVGGLIGKDDLQWGRDMQRFAHQGYAHLPKNFAQRIFIKAFKGVHSPLFPWESQPLYHQKPRFYYELNTDLTYPYEKS